MNTPRKSVVIPNELHKKLKQHYKSFKLFRDAYEDLKLPRGAYYRAMNKKTTSERTLKILNNLQ